MAQVASNWRVSPRTAYADAGCRVAAGAPRGDIVVRFLARGRYAPAARGPGASGQRVRLDVPGATSSMTRARSPRAPSPFRWDVDDEGQPIREDPECPGGSEAVNKGGTLKVTRDAKTGKFVKPTEAKKRPSTTVTETVKRPKK